MTDKVNVPLEPTERMVKAAMAHMRVDALYTPKSIYLAMVAAAPKAEPVEADDFGDALLAFLFRHGLKVALDVSEIEALRQSAIHAQPEAPKVEQEPDAGAKLAKAFWGVDLVPPSPAPASDELLEDDLRVVADTMKEMQDHIERLTGARHSMYDGAVGIARSLAKYKGPQS